LPNTGSLLDEILYHNPSQLFNSQNRQKTNLDSSNSLIATKEAELRQKQALAEADKRNEEKRYKATKLTLSNEQF